MTRKTHGAQPKGPRPRKPDAAVAQPAEPRASTPKTTGSSPAGRSNEALTRRRHDWEAIERDYRTGQFSLRELEAKHGAGYADISRRAKRDGWTQDLRDAVRQATSAALIADIATKAATEAQQTTTAVVLAAAEVNRQVIGRHLNDLDKVRDTAAALLDEITILPRNEGEMARLVEAVTEGADDATKMRARRALQEALSVHNRVTSIQKIADTFRKVQDGQRRALNLDEPGEKPPPETPDPATVTRDTAVDTYRQMVNG